MIELGRRERLMITSEPLARRIYKNLLSGEREPWLGSEAGRSALFSRPREARVLWRAIRRLGGGRASGSSVGDRREVRLAHAGYEHVRSRGVHPDGDRNVPVPRTTEAGDPQLRTSRRAVCRGRVVGGI